MKPFTVLTLLLVAAAVTASGCTVRYNGSEKTMNSTVERVIDGDTVEMKIKGNTRTVRLLGVDTPEVHVDNSPEEFEGVPETRKGEKCLEKWGEKASEYMKKQVKQKETVFKTDPQADNRGDYGRLLGYIYTGNKSINKALIRKGFARVYESRFSKQDQYLELEKDARENLKGLWQCRTFKVGNITVKD